MNVSPISPSLFYKLPKTVKVVAAPSPFFTSVLYDAIGFLLIYLATQEMLYGDVDITSPAIPIYLSLVGVLTFMMFFVNPYVVLFVVLVYFLLPFLANQKLVLRIPFTKIRYSIDLKDNFKIVVLILSAAIFSNIKAAFVYVVSSLLALGISYVFQIAIETAYAELYEWEKRLEHPFITKALDFLEPVYVKRTEYCDKKGVPSIYLSLCLAFFIGLYVIPCLPRALPDFAIAPPGSLIQLPSQ